MATDLFRIVIHQKLNEGQLENFLKVTGGLTAMVEANEPDTLAYEFYVSDDGTEAYAVSTFRDSEAFLAHESRAWDAGYDEPDFGPLTAVVLGSPSAEAREVLTWLKPKYFPLSVGCTR